MKEGGSKLSIQEYINFLQRGIIVHSYLYYECDNSILEDKEYDSKCRELISYKSAYPELWKASEYYEQFGDQYNGATGMGLYRSLREDQQEKIRAIAGILTNRVYYA